MRAGRKVCSMQYAVCIKHNNECVEGEPLKIICPNSFRYEIVMNHLWLNLKTTTKKENIHTHTPNGLHINSIMKNQLITALSNYCRSKDNGIFGN